MELDRWDGVCRYLQNNLCSIYEHRPLVCRIDENYELLKKCVKSIDSKIDGIVIHDNLKSAYKNQIKKLAEELDVPTFKHKKLRNPKDLPIW